jgi:hypothetical protein
VRRDGRDPSELVDFTLEVSDPVLKERLMYGPEPG